MRAIDAALLDTIAACGDVNRNVLAASNPHQSGAHRAAYELAREISDGLLPKTGAWREIWLDGEKVVGGEPEEEPVYGPYISEIGLVGRGPGRYNLYLGAAFDGSRLSKLYLDNADEARIVTVLDALFARYAADREDDERFGDWTVRSGHVARTNSGLTFHRDTGPLQKLAGDA